jgi:hypothetical protein
LAWWVEIANSFDLGVVAAKAHQLGIRRSPKPARMAESHALHSTYTVSYQIPRLGPLIQGKSELRSVQSLLSSLSPGTLAVFLYKSTHY